MINMASLFQEQRGTEKGTEKDSIVATKRRKESPSLPPPTLSDELVTKVCMKCYYIMFYLNKSLAGISLVYSFSQYIIPRECICVVFYWANINFISSCSSMVVNPAGTKAESYGGQEGYSQCQASTLTSSSKGSVVHFILRGRDEVSYNLIQTVVKKDEDDKTVKKEKEENSVKDEEKLNSKKDDDKVVSKKQPRRTKPRSVYIF